MNRRKIIGILLILIGLGFPLVLYFFQDDGVMFIIKTHKQIQRNLNPDEVNALQRITELKKELSDIDPAFEFTYFEPDAGPYKNGRKYHKTPKGDVPFDEFAKMVVEYETAFIASIKTAYAANHFENEAWNIDTRKQIDIPYRQIVGIGVFLVLTGLGFLIFSILPKKHPQR